MKVYAKQMQIGPLNTSSADSFNNMILSIWLPVCRDKPWLDHCGRCGQRRKQRWRMTRNQSRPPKDIVRAQLFIFERGSGIFHLTFPQQVAACELRWEIMSSPHTLDRLFFWPRWEKNESESMNSVTRLCKLCCISYTVWDFLLYPANKKLWQESPFTSCGHSSGLIYKYQVCMVVPLWSGAECKQKEILSG